MPSLTTIADSFAPAGFHGPYYSSAGNTYLIARQTGALQTCRVWKSTDPDSVPFAVQDSANSPNLGNGATIAALWGEQNPNAGSTDIIEVLGQAVDDSPYFARFNMATDSWIELTAGDRDKQIDSNINNTAGFASVCVKVLSNNWQYFEYNGNRRKWMGGDYAKICQVRTTNDGVSFSSPVEVSAGASGADYTGAVMVATDIDAYMHWRARVRTQSTADFVQRPVDSANNLGTERSASNAVANIEHPFGAGIYRASDDLVVMPIDFGSVLQRDYAAVTDPPAVGTERTIEAINPDSVCLAIDGDEIHALYVDSGFGDIYTESTSASPPDWTGAGTLEHAGTVSYVCGAVIPREGKKLGWCATDNGVSTYGEISLGSAPIQASGSLGISSSVTGPASNSLSVAGAIGTSQDLTGTSQLDINKAAATLGIASGLTAAASLQAQEAAALGISSGQTGTGSKVVPADGALAVDAGISGNASEALEADGSLGLSHGTQGSASNDLNATGDIGHVHDQQGTGAVSAEAAAALGTSTDLTGTGSKLVPADGSLNIGSGLSGLSSVTLSASASLGFTQDLQAAAAVIAEETGSLDIGAGLTGNAQAAYSVGALLGVSVGMSGLAMEADSAMGSLGQSHGMSDATQLDAHADSDLAQAHALQGAAQANITAAGTLGFQSGLAGDGLSGEEATGALGLTLQIQGVSQALIEASGALGISSGITGDAELGIAEGALALGAGLSGVASVDLQAAASLAVQMRIRDGSAEMGPLYWQILDPVDTTGKIGELDTFREIGAISTSRTVGAVDTEQKIDAVDTTRKVLK